MSYSAMAHALINYIEGHLDNFDIKNMSSRFGFSEIYLRELFMKNLNMPIMQYYKRRIIITSAFEILHSDRKIIDIALESGFSNHESYTRAFRKIFGMPPSQFRLKRPLIGGKPLDTGVFGLEQLNIEEKRSGYTMKYDNNNTILYGIRKIQFCTYDSRTIFPICVKAVSEYLGDDVSYARIMAATGAAFRLTWNRTIWDLSNIDIYHTLTESNKIYQCGADALGREFSFIGREENTSKEDFTAYIKSNIAKGFPVIALGVIGPPEPCIVAGYEAEGEVLAGWNFFQNDPEFAADVTFMDNGYFRCDKWWENTDTQAVMCIGPLKADKESNSEADFNKKIITLAADVMEPREEFTYAKGISAYDAWKEMLLDESWFENGAGFDELFSKLLVQNDAITCIGDGRKWAAKYFEEISDTFAGSDHDSEKKTICLKIAEHFKKVSSISDEMMSLLGSWNDLDGMLKNFGNRSVREQTGKLIDSAKQEDVIAYKLINQLLELI